MPADLHIHSKISDGSTEIDEIVLIAKNKGLTAISITDHDTLAGSDRAEGFGERFGVKIIHGAEVSSIDPKTGRNVHILCYLPSSRERISTLMRTTLRSRRMALQTAAQKVTVAYPIPYDMILRRSAGSSCIYKQHVMRALMDAGYTSDMFGDVFRKLFDRRFGLAKVKIEKPSVFEVLRIARESGCVTILAHPNVYNNYDLIPELIEHGLDGIEVYYPRAREDDEKVLGDICREHNLIMTGGTDFHGCNTDDPHPIGTCTTSDDQLERIIALAKSRSGKKQFK